MNTFMPRMLFFACVTLSLVLSGCGPKEIEPYQSTTEVDKPKAAATHSVDYAALYDKQGTINEENMESLIEDLPGAEDEDINTSIVETLDTGSGIGEETPAFAGDQEQKTDVYKRKHGRSSTQMKPVYFNFDQSNIRADQVTHLEQNGEYLKSNLAGKVVVEGNCDEQGTNEYNLALGERRAMNAKKYLVKLGVEISRIRTVSYGEERPLFTGSEESDYSYNRRADFVLE
jgi:peptidoglycan-associated lipoprotein